MLVRVGIAKAHIVIGERRNGEDQAVIEQAHLHTRSHLQTMETSVVSVGAYRVRLTINQLLKGLIHNRFVVVRVVRPDIQIDVLGLPRQLHLIGDKHNRLQVGITLPNLVFVNLLRHVRHRRKRRLVTGHVTFVFPEHTFSEVITHRQLRSRKSVGLGGGQDIYDLVIYDLVIYSREIGILDPLLIVAHADRQGDVLPVFLVDGFTDERVLITAHARGHIGCVGDRFAKRRLLKTAVVTTIDIRTNKVEIQVVVVRQVVLVVNVQRRRTNRGWSSIAA